MSKIGIDISVWNTIGNYDDVVNNIDFAILRVGYGVQYLPNQQKDKKFNEFYDNLKGRVPLGAYYYSYASNYDQGWQEAENCLNYIEGRTFELPIYYDLEEQKNTAEAGQGFVDRMREAGVPVGIYASTSFYQNKGLDCIDADSVWIAQYGSNTGSIPSKKPPIPYDIWQYTSKGYVEGVLGDVDMNIKDGDTPTPGPTPTPPEYDPVVLDYQQSWNKTYGDTYGRIKEDGLYGSQTEWSKTKVYLKYGMKNNLIGWCQCRLRYHKGYDLGTSGINHDGVDDCFGDTTREVVGEFQYDNGLDQDFVIGYDTISLLF